MTFELLLLTLGVTLFGGLFMALYFSYRSIESERALVADKERQDASDRKQGFFATPAMIDLSDEEHLVRIIEHHIRRELMAANNYVADPSTDSLWLGVEPRAGTGDKKHANRSKQPTDKPRDKH